MRYQFIFFSICLSVLPSTFGLLGRVPTHSQFLSIEEANEGTHALFGRDERELGSNVYQDKDRGLFLLSARSPTRLGLTDPDTDTNGQSEDKGPQVGLDALHLVGKKLHMDQKKAVSEKEYIKAVLDKDAGFALLTSMVNYVKKDPKRAQKHPGFSQGMKLGLTFQDRMHKRIDSMDGTQKEIQQTLKNIGSVNKATRERMMKDFMPMRSPQAIAEKWPKRAAPPILKAGTDVPMQPQIPTKRRRTLVKVPVRRSGRPVKRKRT